MKTINVQLESFHNALPEVKEILDDHWVELTPPGHYIPLEPMYDIYEIKDSNNEIIFVSARTERGRLVGYISCLVGPTLHSRSVITCVLDFLYIIPLYRSGFLARRLVTEAENEARDRGANRIMMGSKTHMNIERLYKSLGYDMTETYHLKEL